MTADFVANRMLHTTTHVTEGTSRYLPAWLHGLTIYHRLYVYGGVIGSKLLNNATIEFVYPKHNVAVFDIEALKWTILTEVNPPPNRVGHVAVLLGSTIYMYGGSTYDGKVYVPVKPNTTGGIYAFDVQSAPDGQFSSEVNWQYINASVRAFPPCAYHLMPYRSLTPTRT